MAKIYARWVKMGKRTIESVPEHWRAEVQAILDAKNQPPVALDNLIGVDAQ